MSMLIQFSVGNFRSFKDLTTLNLQASTDKEHPENVFEVGNNFNLLKSAVVFGANESGKSNLFTALVFMRGFIFNSSNAQITSHIPVESFKLSTETENKPSHFEIVTIYENVRYRYGFEVTTEKVCAEWLFSYPKGKETTLFTRSYNDIDVNKKKFNEGKNDLKSRTRQNALFLSTIAQFNGEISKKVMASLHQINIISGLNEQACINFTLNKMKDINTKNDILNFIQSIGLDIVNYTTESVKVSPDSLPPILTEEARIKFAEDAAKNGLKILTLHNKFNKDNKVDSIVSFDLANNESNGTQKLFFMAAPILDTLLNGKTLVIDEMDSRLHPLIMEALIKLFNSKERNPNNAQLIFNAHSTLILCRKYFRRDQIWFTQKNRYGVSELYSLDDYSVRKDSSFDKDYLMGKYGGIPVMDMYEEKK